MVSVLARSPKFKPGRGDGFLKVIKIRKHSFLRRGNKAVGSMS
jgi:hypothetical protein